MSIEGKGEYFFVAEGYCRDLVLIGVPHTSATAQEAVASVVVVLDQHLY